MLRHSADCRPALHSHVNQRENASAGRSLARCLRRLSSIKASATASGSASSGQVSRYSVTLKRPLGITFAERVKGGSGGVFVEEVGAGSNAQKAGVMAGDVLVRCSAVVLKTGKEGAFANEGYGATPFTNFERIEFECADQSFDNIMGAISSNNPRWGITDVTLELMRPMASTNGGAAPAADAVAPKPAAAVVAPAPAAPAPAGAAATRVELTITGVDGATQKVTVDKSNVDSTLRALMQAQKVAVYDGWGNVWNCGGAGQCGMCTVDVKAGAELLSERTSAEGKHLGNKKPPTWRLACQTCVNEGATGTLALQAQPQAKK
jgi:ferredoxin